MDLHDNNLFARVVGNITGSTGVKHGYINASHVSNITVGWTPSTLPTPFPLVIVSSLVSFIIACVGWKTTASTWVPPEKLNTIRRRRPEGFENWSWRERWEWSKKHARDIQNGLELENAEAEHVPLHAPDEIGPQMGRGEEHVFDFTQSNEPYAPVPFPFQQDFQPTYAAPYARQTAPAPITRWQASWRNKTLVILSVIYNTMRSIFIIVTTLDVTITRNGTHSAVSSIFLVFLSLQTFLSNRKIPRLISLILVIDLFLVGLAFLIATWDWRTAMYGDATVMGGNCPVYAYDCISQARQWTRIGCGAVVPPISSSGDSDDSPNPNYGEPFYPPYATAGNININANQLHDIESVVGTLGSIWAVLSLLAMLYEAVRTFGSVESMSHLLWPIPMADQFVTSKKTGKTRKRIGWSATVLFAIFALGGAFVVTILSIAGHIAGETRTHTATYIDGFGPAVNTNVTYSTVTGYVNSTAYWGNATSWSDCFTVTTPSSSNGFFKEWLEHNELVAFRFICLL